MDDTAIAGASLPVAAFVESVGGISLRCCVRWKGRSGVWSGRPGAGNGFLVASRLGSILRKKAVFLAFPILA